MLIPIRIISKTIRSCRLDKTSVSSIQHQDLLKAEQLTFILSWLPSYR
ncbi:hypothetical protein GR255_27210, partial [Mycobacterium tuberculosis]|nr:hypothetical protein [Mycobacterium tuberculosis]